MIDPRSTCAVELGALSASGSRRVPLTEGSWRWYAILDSYEDSNLVSMLHFATRLHQPVCSGTYVLGNYVLYTFVVSYFELAGSPYCQNLDLRVF